MCGPRTLPSLPREGPRTRVLVSYHTSSYEAFLDFLHSPARAEPGRNEMVVPSLLNPRDTALGQPPPQTGVRTEHPPDDRRLLALHLQSRGVAVTQADSGLLCAQNTGLKDKSPSANLDILLNPLKQRPAAIPPGKATWRPRAPDSAWPAGTAHTCGARSSGDSLQLGQRGHLAPREERQRHGLCSCLTANAEDLWTADHPTLSLTLP